MRITDDDLDEVALRASETGEHARTAGVLAVWADAVADDSPVTRAALLVAASDQYDLAGDQERRVDLAQRAVDDGGHVEPDARCYLVAALLHQQRHADAQPYVDALLNEPDRDPFVDEFVGESLETAGRYLDALGMYAAAYGRLAPTRPDEARRMLHGRRRCREALGLPPDALDEAARASAGALRVLDEDDLDWALELLPGEPDQEIVVFVTAADWDATTAQLAPGCDSVEVQFATLEQRLRHSDLGLPKVVVPADVPVLRDTAERFGRGPEDEDMRLLHGLERVRAGHGRTWPPGRNEPCWCGRGGKYKRCCGRADR